MNICILYGGRSGEHEISLRSAASVVKNLDPSRYTVVAIGIDKAGRWHLQEKLHVREVPGQGAFLSIVPGSTPVSIMPSDGIQAPSGRLAVDCVFPVLHGSFGEDGTVQGLLEIAGLPYVGAGVPGSAISMDKETAKRLWRDAGLPIVSFQAVDRSSSAKELREAAARIGWPVFVKPCSAGSSLGASRVNDERDLGTAVAQALRYDTRALLERCVDAREIECAVIGNSRPRAFPPGEIVPSAVHGFYDYDAKYTDRDGASLETTAQIDEETRTRIMRAAESAYAAVRCEGMARVDFFLERGTGKLFVNEINTIPGFTSVSMFPRMCEASGLPYARLLDTLIELALARDAEKKTVRYEK
jgi:D-alanine-D-alanine ligase